MLKGYENSNYVVNQYEVCIPVSMIYMDDEIRNTVKAEMKRNGIIYNRDSIKWRQEYIDLYFKMHKEITGVEHEANTVKSDDELWKMYMKHRYESIKRIVHRRKELAIDIWDYPDHNQYYGAKVKPYYDKNNVLDLELSEVCLYHVDPFMRDSNGLRQEFLGFDDVIKLHEIISNIPTEKGEQ